MWQKSLKISYTLDPQAPKLIFEKGVIHETSEKTRWSYMILAIVLTCVLLTAAILAFLRPIDRSFFKHLILHESFEKRTLLLAEQRMFWLISFFPFTGLILPSDLWASMVMYLTASASLKVYLTLSALKH